MSIIETRKLSRLFGNFMTVDNLDNTGGALYRRVNT